MLSAEARLLLICARLELDTELRVALDELLQHELDWSRILDAAQDHCIIPLVARHLSHRAGERVPDVARRDLEVRQRQCAMRSLLIGAVQQEVSNEILIPLGAPHVFIKGAALAQRYYGDPALRQYRDIDVLVASSHLASTTLAMMERGYTITNPAWAHFKLHLPAAFCRYVSAVELRSPRGVLVELHRTLDSTGCIFSSTEVLRSAVLHAGPRVSWPVPPTNELFVYLCYHHGRHCWSSLHWCADIEVLAGYSDFKLAEIHRYASRLALGVTVDETLLLAEDLRRLAFGGNLDHARSRFLPECIRALGESLGENEALDGFLDSKSDNPAGEPDFNFPWQISWRYRLRLMLSRWLPDENDVNAMPLPLPLHGLYYLSRPWRVLWIRLKTLAAPLSRTSFDL